MDTFGILGRALSISWKHKSLWLYGALVMFPVLSILPVTLVLILLTDPYLFPGFALDINHFLSSGLGLVLWFALLAVLMILSFILSTIAYIGPTVGTLSADRGEAVTLRTVWRDSLPFFWRTLGATLLFWLAMMFIIIVIEAVAFVVITLTMGIGMLCMWPLLMLIFPLMIILVAYMELTIAALIQKNLKVLEALKRGWGVIRRNFWHVVLMAIILYFCLWIVSMIISLPLMIPMMLPILFIPDFAGLLGISDQILNALLVAGGIFTALYLLVLFVLMGWMMTFWRGAWALTFSRLSREPVPASLPEPRV